MAMGSPLSPIFANIYMEEFERKALASAQFKPKIWWRLWNSLPDPVKEIESRDRMIVASGGATRIVTE
ncbi:hypothetical protein J6590_035668 [Homalodisca vitripennis]|nr:hypothetical protein J6590_035668 [Homalodisca vitripennis]